VSERPAAPPAGSNRDSSAWAARRQSVPGVFGDVADTYDALRPDYPAQVFDALESVMGQPLLRADVVDVGAGTGISSRALAGRGAYVVAVEPSDGMLEVLRRRTSVIAAVRGRGEALPLRDSCADLVAYAQSFHWTEPERAVPEAARVLRPGGVLAAWWNMAWGDGLRWWDAIDAAFRRDDPSYAADARDYDWGAEIAAACPRDVHVARVDIPWTREVPATQWSDEMRSHSNVAVIEPGIREELLAHIRELLVEAFPSGVAQIPYRTRVFAVRP
jgi:SAM-dependent methyltransferase